MVGIAGGPAKCAYLTDTLGLDAAIDYKAGPVAELLEAVVPSGIDIYFDNVGGDTLNTALAQMNLFGRIIQCGMISSYNNEGSYDVPQNYPMILMNRLRVQGFIVTDYAARFPEAFRALTKLYVEGRLKWRQHEIDGLEQADQAVRLLYTGGNTGKLMVKVADLG